VAKIRKKGIDSHGRTQTASDFLPRDVLGKTMSSLRDTEKLNLTDLYFSCLPSQAIDKLSQVIKGQSYPADENLAHQLVTLPIHSYS
jgi:hypothetical protein